MLFTYTYVPHSMEKMQKYIDYIFYVLWCNAPNRKYDFKLFNGWKELKEIVVSFHYDDTKGGDFFNSKIEIIYQCFSDLTIAEIDQLKQWYKANNNIEKLCNNDPAISPVNYQLLEIFNKPLSDELKLFFKKLYGKDILGLKSVKDKIGDIDDHYHKFMSVNIKGKCPFCGLHDVKGVHHSKREAYDHYLPKGVYPFNSINFLNLAPMCHECNSSYKLAKDPMYAPKDPLNSNAGQRRLSFYVYSAIQPNYNIGITLKTNNIAKLKPVDIDLNIISGAKQEQIDTWMDVYGIDERYKAKCLLDSEGKIWIQQIIEEAENVGLKPIELYKAKLISCDNHPFTDTNFLRKPFLEACEKQGLFDNE